MCNIHTSYEEMVVSKMKLAAGLKEKRREQERTNFFQREEVNRKMMWGRIKVKEEEEKEVCERYC